MEICVNPDAIDIFFTILFILFLLVHQNNFAVQSFGPPVHYMLEPGVGVSGGDSSLYSDQICNKRISYAGPGMVGGGDRAIRPLGVYLHAMNI